MIGWRNIDLGNKRMVNVEGWQNDWIWRYGGELPKGETSEKWGEFKIF